VSSCPWRKVSGGGRPATAKDLRIAANTLNGEAGNVRGCSKKDAALIVPRKGLPKLFIATVNEDYRAICKDVFERQLGISLVNSFFDVDHVLPRGTGLGRFEYTLVNPEDRIVNRTFGGGLEKSSKETRRFEDTRMEKASITEFVKMQGLAPMYADNLASDCLIAVLNAKKSGILSSAQAHRMWDSIENSNNNLVRDACAKEPGLKEEAKRLGLIPRGE